MASLTVEQTIVYAKYEIFSASSAIGGLFGMFLGGSMLTVYELAELIVRLIMSKLEGFSIWWMKHRRKNLISPVLIAEF